MTSRSAPAVRYPKKRATQRRYRPWWLLALVAVVAAVAAVYVAVGRDSRTAQPTRALPGLAAPAFSERDVVSGRPVDSAALRGRNVLLFFSEGVMCQPCFDQIKALEQESAELKQRKLVLVSITNDPVDVLREAGFHHEISTPLVSDEDRDMSRAYNVLGVQGAMHADRAGHTFFLVDGAGTIRWRRDYTTMYVRPAELLKDIPRI